MKIKSIKFNFLMNLILTLSKFLFPLITFPYVSRVLLPEGTGKVAFAISVINYFSVFAMFGVSTYGVRATAQVRDNKESLSRVTHEILFINFILMLIVYVIFFIFLKIIPDFIEEKTLFVLASSIIFFTIIGVEWLYKGLEQYQYITIRTIIFRLIALVATFLFVKTKDDYIIFAAITIFATVGPGIINLVNLKRLIFIKYLSGYNIISHIRPMFIFFLTSLSITMYTVADSAILGLMTDSVEVGFYNAAIRIKDILLSIITALGIVLLPRLSYYVKNNMFKEFHNALNKSINFVFIVSLPIAVFFILFAEPIILILAGSEYLNSVLPLQIMMLAIIFIGITNILGIQMLIPLKKERALFFSVLLAALINILLNLCLVPHLAAVGTAISLVCAEFIVLVVQLSVLREYYSVLFIKIGYKKIAIALVLSSLLSYCIYYIMSFNLIINFVLSTALFYLLYFITLFFLKEQFTIYIINLLLKKNCKV